MDIHFSVSVKTNDADNTHTVSAFAVGFAADIRKHASGTKAEEEAWVAIADQLGKAAANYFRPFWHTNGTITLAATEALDSALAAAVALESHTIKGA